MKEVYSIKHGRRVFKLWTLVTESVFLVVEYLRQSYGLYVTKMDNFVYSFVPPINIY